MASDPALCAGCQERDRELRHLRRRLAVQTEEHQSLLRENRRLVRRPAKLELQNCELRQRLNEARREQHRQTHPFRRRKTDTGKPKKPGRRKGHPPALRPVPTLETSGRENLPDFPGFLRFWRHQPPLETPARGCQRVSDGGAGEPGRGYASASIHLASSLRGAFTRRLTG